MSQMLKLTCSSCNAAYRVAASLVRGRVVHYLCKHCKAQNLTDGRSLGESFEPGLATGSVSTADGMVHLRAIDLSAALVEESEDANALLFEATARAPLQVLLGWSGDRSRAVAAILRETLPDFVDGIEPWMSEEADGGSFGAAIMSDKREGAKFGIVCVTPENQHSAWLNYEAGACAKLFRDSRAVSFVYDLNPSNLKPPLGLLHAKASTEGGTWQMIRMLNRAVAAPLPDDRLRKRFDAFWSQLAGKLAEIRPPGTSLKTERPQQELLGEILDRVRGVETYLNSQVAPSSLSDQIWDVCQLVLQEIREAPQGEKRIIAESVDEPEPAPSFREPSHVEHMPRSGVVFDYDDDDQENTGLHSSAPPPVVEPRESTTNALAPDDQLIPIVEAASGDSLDDVSPPTSG